jgi:cysteinyl-tRNA synthetase
MLSILGLDPLAEHWRADALFASDTVEKLAHVLLEQREAARTARDFETADSIRNQLRAVGLEIEDTPDGPQLRWH